MAHFGGMARPALTQDEVQSRRDELLDVAQELFDQQGLEAVSFRRIAAMDGCSSATPYRYFPSKAHILLGLRIRAFDAIRDVLAQAAAGVGSPVDQLRAISRSYVQFSLERPEAYSLLFAADPAVEADPELARAKRDALGVCSDALASAEAAGALKLRTDPLTAAHLAWAAAHGAVSLHHGGQLVLGRSLDEIVPPLIQTLTSGLIESGDTA